MSMLQTRPIFHVCRYIAAPVFPVTLASRFSSLLARHTYLRLPIPPPLVTLSDVSPEDSIETAHLDLITSQASTGTFYRACFPERLRVASRTQEDRVQRLVKQEEDFMPSRTSIYRKARAPCGTIVGTICAKTPAESPFFDESTSATTSSDVRDIDFDDINLPELPPDCPLRDDEECDTILVRVIGLMEIIMSVKEFKKKPTWDIVTLQVHPDWQRRGIGSLLLDDCIRSIKQSRWPLLPIAVTADTNAEGFYRKHGFRTFDHIRVSTSYNQQGDQVKTEYAWPLMRKNLSL